MRTISQLRYSLYRRWQYGEFRWRHGLNSEAVLRQRRNPLPVSASTARKALSSLRRDGVSVFDINDLTGGNELFQRIVAEQQMVIKLHSQHIVAQRSLLQSGARQSFKDFLIRFIPGNGYPSYEHASSRLALHPVLLGIVNAYLGMYSELRALEHWHTLACPSQTPTASQLWHRDHEDIALVKVFLYLNDVDESGGPFSFVPATHRGHLRWRDPESVVPSGTIRADDERMAAMVPRSKWFVGTGKAGTVIMAATKGYHQGGFATHNDRQMLVMAYMSRACRENYLPNRVARIPEDAHPAVRFAAQQERAWVDSL